jgi:hypothetical protein
LNCKTPTAVAGVTAAVNVTWVPWVTGEGGFAASAVLVIVAPAGAATTNITAGDVDGLNAAGLAGVNTAVSGCDPTVNVDVVPDAVPLVTITGLPRVVVPSLNCTVPAAVTGVTVAVSVRGTFGAMGESGDVASAVLVAGAPATTNVTVGEVDGPYAAGSAGLNTASSEREPAARADVNPDAVPLLTITGLPRFVVPSLNCTVPTAVAGVTVAFNAT